MVRKPDLLEFTLVFHRRSDAGDNELEMSRALDPFRFVLIAVAGLPSGQVDFVIRQRQARGHITPIPPMSYGPNIHLRMKSMSCHD
jgi:hypothetical protein